MLTANKNVTGISFTGAAVNPTRAFGPAVVTHTFPPYHWIYWVGPFLGALLAAGLYKFMKVLEYENANPGQDSECPLPISRLDPEMNNERS
jgi:aquaporin related protein